ncbi:MAG: tyrosine-protein phosphatase [Clostridia bacterium]|nr:tyrosine-protein phosphatase [Clostridia bacterium]
MGDFLNFGLRPVTLPDFVDGKLFLSRMPGRFEPIAEAEKALVASGIQRIVCLASEDEIKRKAPEYWAAIQEGRFREAYSWEQFPIPDFGVPEDRQGFLKLAHSIADGLKSGQSILIHCGAGIGRTGTLAMSALIALGMELDQASKTVHAAGSGPETGEQRSLVHWVNEERRGS